MDMHESSNSIDAAARVMLQTIREIQALRPAPLPRTPRSTGTEEGGALVTTEVHFSVCELLIELLSV